MKRIQSFALLLLFVLTTFIVGCGNSQADPPAEKAVYDSSITATLDVAEGYIFTANAEVSYTPPLMIEIQKEAEYTITSLSCFANDTGYPLQEHAVLFDKPTFNEMQNTTKLNLPNKQGKKNRGMTMAYGIRKTCTNRLFVCKV